MDSQGPIGDESRRSRSSRRQVATEYRGGRARQRNGVAAVAVVVLVVVLIAAFVVVRTGVLKGFRPPAPASSSAASAPQAGTSTTDVTGSSATTKTASASSSATSSAAKPSWSTADPSWMDKYKGVIIDGFKPQAGYKAVALTFDDGPNGETAYVINTLKKYKGEATFFDTGRKLVMGWAKGQPLLIQKAGFELGNHTQHHTINNVSSMWHRTAAVDLAEINGPDQIITANGGTKTIWLRPMGGMIDATAVKAAVDTNHLVINWTIDSNDSHGGPRTPDYLYQQCTTNVRSGDVILLHVTHPESMQALPRICATLSQEGFKLVTLSDLAQHSTGAITQKISQ